MNAMLTVIIVIQVLSALAIIGLVLIQHGKGADMGAAFGSGASGSLFGASGSSNFLSKLTAVAATIFFVATLGLAFVGTRPNQATGGVMDKLPASSVPGQTAPATPAAPTAPVPGAAPAPAAPPAGTVAPSAPVPGAPTPAGQGQSGQIPK